MFDGLTWLDRGILLVALTAIVWWRHLQRKRRLEQLLADLFKRRIAERPDRYDA